MSNNIQQESIEDGAAAQEPSSASEGAEGSKRKILVSPTTSSSTQEDLIKTKKTRQSFIDDELACPIFRELNLTDALLSSGKILPWALDPEYPDFININDYISNSDNFGFGWGRQIKIVYILRLLPSGYTHPGESPVIEFKDDPKVAGQQRKMLWYGTKKENVASILENGLKSEDPELGIHFGDRILEVLWRCDPIWNRYGNPEKRYGYLFLSDVLLGDITRDPSINVSDTATATHVKNCGLFVPDPTGERLIDGCVWPMGTTIQAPTPVSGSGPYYSYNGYIIHAEKQVQLKYLVQVELI